MGFKNIQYMAVFLFGLTLQACGGDNAAFMLNTGDPNGSLNSPSGSEQFRVGGGAIDPSKMTRQDPNIDPQDLVYENPNQNEVPYQDVSTFGARASKDAPAPQSQTKNELYVNSPEHSPQGNGPGSTTSRSGTRQQAQEVSAINWGNSTSTGALRPSRTQLWPPNHKLVAVSVFGQASSSCRIINVTDNESNLADDAIITGDLSVDLRASRSGTSRNGRIYFIELSCIDTSGARSEEHLEVVVPHDQRN